MDFFHCANDRVDVENDLNIVEEFRKLPRKLSNNPDRHMEQLYDISMFIARALVKNHNVSVAVLHIYTYISALLFAVFAVVLL